MKKLILLLLLFAINSKSELLFKPFLANPFEPRIGSIYQFDDEKLRLDIGYSHDLAKLNLSSGTIAFGADFFTYTRLRSDGRFKFPVETSDYFFGVNSSYSTEIFDKELSFRLRISHISSHLVDGFSKSGIFEKMPFTYSREFLDFAASLNLYENFRIYGGLNYVFSTIPKNVEAISTQIGFEYNHKLNELFELVIGYDNKLLGIDSEFAPQNALEAGFNIITSDNAKINLNYFYYEGRSIHGMFFDEFDNYSGLGFRIIFY